MADDGGLMEFQKRMQAIPEAVRRDVQPALLKAGEELAGVMRGLAPDDPATDAPDLKSSIAVTGPGQRTPEYSQPGGSAVVPENAVAVTVGNTDVRYPHLLEFGWTGAPAQPFFWPSVRLTRKKITNRIKRAISKAVKNSRAS